MSEYKISVIVLEVNGRAEQAKGLYTIEVLGESGMSARKVIIQ